MTRRKLDDLLCWRMEIRQISLAALLFALMVASLELSHASSSFTWEASIDRPTGIATSRECSLVRIIKSDDDADSIEKDSSVMMIQQISKDLVASWADFLCQGRITFGLLQTRHDSSAGTASLHLRGFPGLSILTFGSVQEKRQGQQYQQQWELPIMLPSCLARPPDPNRPEYFGLLRFECQPVKTLKEESSTSSASTAIVELKSQIVDFRPWLAGKTVPISRFREFFYLHTQSQIHAYVTRRFHGAWGEALQVGLESPAETNG